MDLLHTEKSCIYYLDTCVSLLSTYYMVIFRNICYRTPYDKSSYRR